MRIKSIANNRDMGGYFYSSLNYHPIPNHLQIEPWLGGHQLRLDEEVELPDSLYITARKLLEDLKEHRIIHFEPPIIQEKLVEVVEDQPKRIKVTSVEIDIPVEILEQIVEEKVEEKLEEMKVEVEEVVEAKPVKTWPKKGKKK